MLPILQHSISFQPFRFTLNKTHRKSASGPGRNQQARLPRRNSGGDFSLVLGAVKKDSEFEVDPVRAREALRKLDEQFQSLATRPDKISPRIEASDLDRLREQAPAEIEISGEFLAKIGTGLVIFTVLYNIFFLAVIKPSIDGPDTYDEPISFDVEAEITAPLQEQF